MRIWMLGILSAALALSQNLPESTQVNMYFPHVTDGGGAGQKWQTTFTFSNPTGSDAVVDLSVFDDTGASWDVLAGSSTFVVPAYSIYTVRTKATSATIKNGWAMAVTSRPGSTSTTANATGVPMQATVAFRMFVNGVAKQELSAPPSLPVLDYQTFGTNRLGVAIANVYASQAVTVRATIFSQGQQAAAPVDIALQPLQHISFNLFQKFGSFSGNVVLKLSGKAAEDIFVAWAVSGDEQAILSTLPSGNIPLPVSQYDRVPLVFQMMNEAVLDSGYLSAVPELDLQLPATHTVDSYSAAGSNGGIVHITYGLADLFSDSPSELAWLFGHHLGHLYQDQNGGKLEFGPDAETDADIWGLFLAMRAGYDPYGAVGGLAKLSMATTPGSLLADRFEDFKSIAEAHTSLASRLANWFATTTNACKDSEIGKLCQDYRTWVHPNITDNAPLFRRKPSPSGQRGLLR